MPNAICESHKALRHNLPHAAADVRRAAGGGAWAAGRDNAWRRNQKLFPIHLLTCLPHRWPQAHGSVPPVAEHGPPDAMAVDQAVNRLGSGVRNMTVMENGAYGRPPVPPHAGQQQHPQQPPPQQHPHHQQQQQQQQQQGIPMVSAWVSPQLLPNSVRGAENRIAQQGPVVQVCVCSIAREVSAVAHWNSHAAALAIQNAHTCDIDVAFVLLRQQSICCCQQAPGGPPAPTAYPGHTGVHPYPYGDPRKDHLLRSNSYQ